MDLKLPIQIFDELTETVIKSTGQLDLASGEIRNVQYENYDKDKLGLPAEDESYEFTSGLLTNGTKDVEFRVEVQRCEWRPENGRFDDAQRQVFERSEAGWRQVEPPG